MTDIITARKRVRHDSGISTDSSTHKYPECYKKKEKTGSDVMRPMDNFTRNRIETVEAKIAHLTNFLAIQESGSGSRKRAEPDPGRISETQVLREHILKDLQGL